MKRVVEDDIVRLSASQLGAEFRRGELSPVEAAAAHLRRIEAMDAAINSFCVVDTDVTMAAAARAEGRIRTGRALGPLDGVPIAIKDVAATAVWPTRKGSRAAGAAGPRRDAPAVGRILAAGGVMLGKTTTPELGWKAVTDSPLTGITRNPWNTDMTSGGSSGGSAAAVAAFLAPLAVGTDGGGSIRIPSSMCGVTGLKPTVGLVPQWPPSPFGVVSHLGPHARSAADAALLLSVMAGPCALDPQSAAPRGGSTMTAPVPWVKGLRVAYSPDLGGVRVQEDVANRVEHAVAVLSSLGADVRILDHPGFDDPLETFETLWYSGAARAVSRLTDDEAEMLDPGLRAIADRGARLGASDYVAALEARVQLSASIDEMLSSVDILVTPSLPLDSFEVGADVPNGWSDDRWMTWTPFTYPFNISGHPALSVPCGLSDRGLPVGLQLVGRKFDDGRLLGIASALEQVLPAMSPPGW